MTRKQKKYLFDILMAIDNILDTHLQGIADKEAFGSNLTVQRAVERELGIIGEACFRLKKLELELPSSDPMINRRNTLVHQYDIFKAGNIWDLIRRDLEPLKDEVSSLLEN
ncbi:MAG: HepT-like ribonuclease domain-containing protein [Bacteroidota bacterium]